VSVVTWATDAVCHKLKHVSPVRFCYVALNAPLITNESEDIIAAEIMQLAYISTFGFSSHFHLMNAEHGPNLYRVLGKLASSSYLSVLQIYVHYSLKILSNYTAIVRDFT